MPSYSLNGTSARTEQPELRSEEVQEILGQMPGWTIRWGITVVGVIIVLILLASWFIRYPDTIVSRVLLTTQIPPAPIVARSGGRLHLLVQDAQSVTAGDMLATIDNPAHQEDVFRLEKQLASFNQQQLLQSDNHSHFSEDLQLGELQTTYLHFLGTLKDEQFARQQDAYARQTAALQHRIQQYQQLNRQLAQQNTLLAEQLALGEKQLNRDHYLFREKTIAEADWEKSQSEFLQIKRTYEAAQTNILNNEIQISQLQAQITDLTLAQTKEQSQQQQAVSNALRQLESELAGWQQQYVLKAPITGKVTFTKYWSDAQFVQPGNEVMTVVPKSQELYGQVLMPVTGSGKVAVGQAVHMKFDNYPFAEYGTVYGEVASISAVPRENMYTIEVRLPRGLVTSYRKELPFRQEMQGSAEILTQDLRLTERIFYQLRALLDQNK